MGNLTESASYDSGVYQLETADPVQGGAAGVSNAPLKNLANRTAYLKQHMDAIENGTFIPSAVAPINSPLFTGDPRAPTPALGDSDTSISTTEFVQKTIAGLLNKSVAGGVNVTLSAVEAGNGIWNLTGALTANIAVIVPNTAKKFLVLNRTSGAFTLTVKTAANPGIVVAQGKQQALACDGTNVFQETNDLSGIVLDGVPTLTNTPAQFDNSQKLVNSAFVQRALGNYAGEVVVTAATTFTAAHAGKLIVFNSASALTHTLPAANGCIAGTQIALYFYGAGAQTIQRAASDTIGVPTSLTSFIGTYGDTAVLVSDGVSQWRLIGGSLNLPNSGVIKGPNFTTAAQFDNSNRLATTQFVKSSSQQFAGVQTVGANRTLGPQDMGLLLVLNVSSSTTVLPPATVGMVGQSITIWNAIGSGVASTVNVAGSDTINSGNSTYSTITLMAGDYITFTVIGANAWAMTGTGVLQKSSSFTASLGGGTGYQKLPSGTIFQWMQGVSDGNGYLQFNFPIAFPTTFSSAALMTSAGNSVGSIVGSTRFSLTIATYVAGNGAITANMGFYCLAVGY